MVDQVNWNGTVIGGDEDRDKAASLELAQNWLVHRLLHIGLPQFRSRFQTANVTLFMFSGLLAISVICSEASRK